MNKKLKLSFMGALLATSSLAITTPIVSCSLFSETNDPIEPILLTSINESGARREIRLFILKQMQNLNNFEAQRELARQLEFDKILSDDYSSKIMNIISFEDHQGEQYLASSVIDNIVFNHIIVFQKPDGPDNFSTYLQMEIKINFIDGYTTIDDLIIDTGLSIVSYG
ncbi:MAG: hypothetical protein ACRCUM_00400 [Mycoplasmoidaceae bacterium]